MAGTVREMRAIFTATMAGLRSAARSARKEVAGIGDETEKTVKKSNKNLDALTKKVKEVDKELGDIDSSDHLSETNETIKDTTDSMDDLQTQIKKSREEFKKLDDSTKVKDDKGRFYSLSFKRLEESVINLQTEFKETGKVGEESFSNFTREVSKAKAALSQLGDADGVNELSLAIQETEKHVMKLGRDSGLVDFEVEVKKSTDAMDKLRDVVMDATVVGKAFKLSLIGLAPAAVPVLASVTTATMGLVSSLGAATAGVAGFATVAIPNLMQVFEAQDEINKAQDKYDKAVTEKEKAKALQELNQIYDGLNKNQLEAVKSLQEFKSYFDDLRSSFEAPVLNIFTQSLKTLQTVLEAFRPAIDSSVGAVQNLLNSFDQSLQTKDVESFFGFLAMRAGPALEAWGKSFGYIFRGVGNLMVAFNDEGIRMEKGLVNLTKRFSEWAAGLKESESFKAFIDYSNRNTPVFLQLLSNLWTILKNTFQFLAPLGEEMLSILTFLTGLAAKASEVAKEFSKWEGFVPLINGIIAAIIAYNVAIRAQAVATGLMTKAQKLLNAVMRLNPIALVVALLIGLGVALYTAYKKSETFRNIVNGVWDSVKSKAQEVFGFLKPYIDQAISAVVGFARDKLTQLKTFWEQNGDQILQATKNVYSFISSFIQSSLRVVMAIFQFVFPFVLALVKSVWGNIQGVINGALNMIMGLVKIFAGLFTGDFKKMWEGVKQLFSGAVQFIWNFVQLHMFGKLLSLGKIFASGFSKLISGLWNGLKSLFSKGVNAVKDFLVNGFNTMKSRASTILTNMKNDATKIFDNLVDAAKKLPGRIGDGLKSMASKVGDGVKAVGNKMATGLENVINKITQDGINSILKKMGVEKNLIPKLDIPEFKRGGVHKGGPFIAGDGGKPELIKFEDGTMTLSPATDTLYYGGKGTEILSGKETEEAFKSMVPHYKSGLNRFANGAKAIGEWTKDKTVAAGKATKKVAVAGKDKVVAGAQKVGDVIGDVWEYASNPKKLLDKVLSSMDLTLPSINGSLVEFLKTGVSKIKNGGVDLLKRKFKELNPFEGGTSTTGPAGKGAARWRSTIIAAAARMNEQISEFDIQGIIAQIQRESGGNQNIVQSPLVRDINTRMGNPARGLLQYIPQTFRAYAVKGHNNIYSGYDQLLAFFNNTTWRRDNPRGTRGWGPRGRRKYEKGGIINHEHEATVGEGGKAEVIIPLEQFRQRALQLFKYVGEYFGFDMDALMSGGLSSVVQGLSSFAQQASSTVMNTSSTSMSTYNSLQQSGLTNNSTQNGGYSLKDMVSGIRVDVQMGDIIMDGRQVAKTTEPFIKRSLIKDLNTDAYRRGRK
ncbi:hypothetical protein P8864_10315 [Priestia flexa]|uniref:hypothetical protein n=1 Tax=Priestia flexa TaxID=86664 RepID=UPI000C24961C|nr:hypothetical protein [Priestia flexa]MEC0666282.1 hypothetical protein [Priestia flexa]